jgi:hypothetical protein
MSFCDFFNSNYSFEFENNIIIPEKQDNMSFIVSKFNENVSYIQYFNNVFLYDKNPVNSENFYKYIKPDIKYEHLLNVGRESHTYIYHIIKHYDNLSDINIFMSASTLTFSNMYKVDLYKKLLYIYYKTKDTVFFRNPKNLLESFIDFKINKYSTKSKENNCFDNYDELTESIDGNYGNWYIKNFGFRNVNYGSYGGILLLHKRHILQHPKKYYEDLISYLDKSNSPEEGHYFERAWGAVFYPIDEKCIFNVDDFDYKS